MDLHVTFTGGSSPFPRSRLALTSSQTIYLVVKNRSLTNMSVTIGEVDQEFKDSDGFLYISYASQEMFGAS